MNAQVCLFIYSTMTMQVKEERVDTDYHRSGQHVAGSQPQQYAQQQQPPPPIFPPPGTYPIHSSSMMMPNNVQTSKPEDTVSESQIDFSSVKGIFGWTSIDGVDVPYIFRKDKMFVSVRIVEQKLLNKYPNSYPDDLGKHQPLTSFFITPHECKLLNEINQVHCGGEFGTKLFSIKDLIVLLSDFVEFYNLVKKTFPENARCEEDAHKSLMGAECGWLQVNNTVSPYVKRKTDKFVPLSVMKYAAALSIPGTGVLPETEECDLLNKACKIAGFNFSFSKTTRIISLSEIMKNCMIKIMELPMENPLQHAQYIEIPSSNNNTNNNNLNKPPEESPKPEQQKDPKSPVHEMVQAPFHPNIHPSFMDPRMMFSYNRHPFNMYAMQYGPPNVTVNPQQYPHMYNQGMGPPPPYINGQIPNQQTQGSRNPTPEGRPSQSPVRSPSNGSASTAPQPKSPGRLTSPNHYPQMRPQLSPGSYHGPLPMSQGIPVVANRPQNAPQSHANMPPGHNMMYPNPMANFMQQRGQLICQKMSSNAMNNTPNIRPGIPNSSQGPPQRHLGSRPQMNANMRQNSQQNQKTSQPTTGGKQPMPPPPSMSGPHQGPMNALQSMVSHQNGQMRHPIPHNSSMAQRTMQNGFNPNATNNPALRTNMSNNNHSNNYRPNISSSASIRKDPNGPTANGGGNIQRQAETVSNGASTENKEPEKCINQVLVESIKGVWLGGKSISCMHLNCPGRSGKFCLVEAVCKLYFSGCSVNEFLYALENVLKVPLVTCTDDEEKAFIHYYSLPVTVLKCNKMIDFEDLEKFFPQLSYVFKEKTGNGTPHKTLSQSTDESSSAKSSPQFPAMPLTISEMQQQSNKRQNETPNSGPPAKASKRLEDTVQRLMHQQEISTGL
jgi:hypothetical protein